MRPAFEEAAEVAGAPASELPGEIADQLEVLEALASAYGITQQQIAEERERKLRARGGFGRRLRLVWTETPNDPAAR